MSIPNINDVYVKNFCKKLSKIQPTMIPCKPAEDSVELECMSNVQKKVKINGGSILYGWLVNEWKKVLIEGQFHAVWKSPDNNIFDLTPNPLGSDYVLFVPDYSVNYQGKQIDNIRKSLSKDGAVIKLIRLHEERYCFFNTGDLADQYGGIIVNSKRIWKADREIDLTLKYLVNKYGPDI